MEQGALNMSISEKTVMDWRVSILSKMGKYLGCCKEPSTGWTITKPWPSLKILQTWIDRNWDWFTSLSKTNVVVFTHKWSKYRLHNFFSFYHQISLSLPRIQAAGTGPGKNSKPNIKPYSQQPFPSHNHLFVITPSHLPGSLCLRINSLPEHWTMSSANRSLMYLPYFTQMWPVSSEFQRWVHMGLKPSCWCSKEIWSWKSQVPQHISKQVIFITWTRICQMLKWSP